MNSFPPLSVFFGVALTWCCWGGYGTCMQKAHAGLGSSFKGIHGVSWGYFILGVVVTGLIIHFGSSSSAHHDGSSANILKWDRTGTAWSLGAGALGLGGALGVAIALAAAASWGGPQAAAWVMPFVFGGAPLLNLIWSAALLPAPKSGYSAYFNPTLLIGLVLVGSGAWLVMYSRPR